MLPCYVQTSFVTVVLLVSRLDLVQPYANGFPCSTQYTMRPLLQHRGTPSAPSKDPPPYLFSIFDSKQNPVKHYTDEIYTIRISSVTPFRQFLLQARLATRQGFVIGHLRAGEFLADVNWYKYGIKFQECQTHVNNSITNSNDNPKFIIEAKWHTIRNEGPIQFVITIVKDADNYWVQWQPPTGLIFPDPAASFEKKNSIHIKVAKQPSPDEEKQPLDVPEARASNLMNAIAGGDVSRSKSGEQVVTPQGRVRHLMLNSETNRIVEDVSSSSLNFGHHMRPTEGGDSEEELYDWCADKPCKNGATCRNMLSAEQYECICTPQWTGATCEKRNYCHHHKCKKGICINGAKGYTCQCDLNYGGKYCDRQCPSSRCLNGGTCVIDDSGLHCACLPGFSGHSCEHTINECAENPCENKATCINNIGGFTCICPIGYMGERCQRPCQDIYGSCEFWGEQDRCESMRPATKFFDINCAVTCKQCRFSNLTVKTVNPLPPSLEPFQWIMGKWKVEYSRHYRYPLNLDSTVRGYNEEMEIVNDRVMMFGVPYLNYTVRTTARNDPNDTVITYGFMTLEPAPTKQKVAIMMTSNDGITVIEEGVMEGTGMKLHTAYHKTHPANPIVETNRPFQSTRKFDYVQPFIRETVQVTRKDGRFDYFTKYFSKKRTV